MSKTEKKMYKADKWFEFDSLEKVEEFNDGANCCYTDYGYADYCSTCKLIEECKSIKLDILFEDVEDGEIDEQHFNEYVEELYSLDYLKEHLSKDKYDYIVKYWKEHGML